MIEKVSENVIEFGIKFELRHMRHKGSLVFNLDW